MAMPLKKREAPGGTGATQSDLLAGRINFNLTDYAAMVAEAQTTFVSELMHLPVDVARDHLLPADWTPAWREPKIGMVYTGVIAAIDEGINPTPLAVTDMLRRNGIRLPSHVRGELLVYVNRLFGEAPAPVTCWYHRGLVIEFAVWERARNQARRIDEMPLQGATLTDLADLMLVQFGSVPAYLQAAIEVLG
jgi:hypothetical protein